MHFIDKAVRLAGTHWAAEIGQAIDAFSQITMSALASAPRDYDAEQENFGAARVRAHTTSKAAMASTTASTKEMSVRPKLRSTCKITRGEEKW